MVTLELRRALIRQQKHGASSTTNYDRITLSLELEDTWSRALPTMLSAFTARPIVELKQRDKSKIESILAYGRLHPLPELQALIHP